MSSEGYKRIMECLVKVSHYGTLIVIFTGIFICLIRSLTIAGHISKLFGQGLDGNQENQHEFEKIPEENYIKMFSCCFLYLAIQKGNTRKIRQEIQQS